MPASSIQPAIITHELTRMFGTATVVEKLNLEVFSKEIVGLIGPDGAGKTTALRMLAAILPPTSGEAVVAGYSVKTDPAAVKEHIAYMGQRFALYEDLTVAENIRFYADLYGVPPGGLKNRMEELLDFSAMGAFQKRRAGALSGGMKQKLQLVCALIHTPQVLLLDEPTNGVDPVSRRDFWRILGQLRDDNVAILVTTSHLDESERCDRVYLLDNGRLAANGPPAQLRAAMTGTILVIKSDQSLALRRLLREATGLDALPFGDNLHILSHDAENDRRRLHQALAGFGVDGEIATGIPAMEDVFISLVQGGPPLPIRETSAPDEAGPTVATPRPPGSQPVVEAKGLSRRFGRFVAVDDLSFSVMPGEIFGFLGPNGAGKSTTIRMLCGLLQPSGGQGMVAGFDLRRDTEAVKRRIGYMSQKFSLYDDLTVVENINFYGGVYGLSGEALETRREWAIHMSGLAGRGDGFTKFLPGGIKQRLALACAILHDPPVVFLDEPTSGVDPVSRRRFWSLIHSMAEGGKTIFVTTHYMDEAEYCGRLALISDGRMIAHGSPSALKRAENKASLEEVFISLVEAAGRRQEKVAA
ncbi:MAG: ATP-binding cassette domain-containing protein [Desulfobulbaceae bacterium]|jgi:ABC-2 type transport system ATP-binding protein|nr:ATP-binding cassette domain-containing protein [Desulfobulbaceae bacterium]